MGCRKFAEDSVHDTVRTRRRSSVFIAKDTFYVFWADWVNVEWLNRKVVIVYWEIRRPRHGKKSDFFYGKNRGDIFSKP